MRCGACGREGHPIELVSGEAAGAACDDDGCRGLVLEAHLNRFVGATKDDLTLLRWRVARHRAHLQSVPFTEPAPSTVAERVLDAWEMRVRLKEELPL